MGAASSVPFVPVVSKVADKAADITTDVMEFGEPIARQVADVLEYIPTPKAQYGAIMLDAGADMSENIRKDNRRGMLTNIGEMRSARRKAKLNTADIYGGYFDDVTGETYYQDARNFYDDAVDYRPSLGNDGVQENDEQVKDPIISRLPLDRTQVPRRFPASWGRPPDVPNAKQVRLPFNLGFGSTNLRDWIVEKSTQTSGVNTSQFPSSWGDVPLIQTKDLVTLPGGYGQGSSTLANWISENIKQQNGASKLPLVIEPRSGGAGARKDAAQARRKDAAPARRDSDRRGGRTYKAMDTYEYVYPPMVQKLGTTFMETQAMIADASKSLKDDLKFIKDMLLDAMKVREVDQDTYAEYVNDDVNHEIFIWYPSRGQRRLDDNLKTKAWNNQLKIAGVLRNLRSQWESVRTMMELYESKIGSDVRTTSLPFLEQDSEWLGDVLVFISRLAPILENHVARLRSFELHTDAMRQALSEFEHVMERARRQHIKNRLSLSYVFREYDIGNFDLEGKRINTNIDGYSFKSGLGDFKMLDKMLATHVTQGIKVLSLHMQFFLILLNDHSASIVRLLATRL
jgi:hypothetical protein